MTKTYDSYKDSGFEWVGKIPELWNNLRLRFVCEFRNGYTPSKANPEFWENGSIPWYRMEDIRERGRKLKEAKLYVTKEAVKGGGLFEAGSFILATTATIGEHAVLIVDSLANQQFTNLKIRKSLCNKLLQDYMFYYLYVIDEYCKTTTKTSTFPAVSMELLKNCHVVFPSVKEQQHIVDYLNQKCDEINSLISTQEEMITELQAYKESVITEAVTKGLNQNVQIKDSGVEWIGDIPENWSIKFLSKIIWLRARLGWKGLKAEEYVENGYPFLSAFNIVNNKLDWTELNFINQERYDESPEIKLSEGDVLIVKDGAGIGKTARIDKLPLGESTVNSSLGVITPSEQLNYVYLYYFLLSNPFQNTVGFLKNGMGVPHLTQENMKAVLIPVPPLDEQQAIASYLDEKTSQIDALIAVKQEKITELKDYKKSIIYEYVTGKKRV